VCFEPMPIKKEPKFVHFGKHLISTLLVKKLSNKLSYNVNFSCSFKLMTMKKTDDITFPPRLGIP
jgi:hypothetical protein